MEPEDQPVPVSGAAPLSSYVESWTPGPVTDEDPLPVGPVAALSAVLDLPDAVAKAGDPLPPLWHWLYFLSWPAQGGLGPDGHPLDGHFLPPVPHRQRMWAGGRCEIREPLRLGEPAERVRSLGALTAKQGRTGELLFVTERREFRQRGRLCVVEEQDSVYRSGRSAGQHPGVLDQLTLPDTDSPWQLPAHPDPALLFRFSALTANAHRIHYDAPYCRDEEGYPGLVVHGPLLALLMLELPRRRAPDRRVRSLSYRLHKPVFGGEHLAACGTPAGEGAELWAATHREGRHATAQVTFG
ncbi:hypothetical protein ACWD5F_04355 [Streptomyces sp. NPDC002499]